MRVLIVVMMIFMYMGCSTKQSSDILNLKIQQKETSSINIAKSGDFLFYAYLKEGDRLTKISKNKNVPKSEDEEIVRVYSNGYYPIYNKLDQKKFACSLLRPSENADYCHSYYTFTSIVKDSVKKVILTAISLGIGVLMADTYIARFSSKKFKQSILKSGLNKIRKQLSNNNNFNLLLVHKVKTVEDKIELSKVNLDVSGIILMDNYNNLLGIAMFNDLKQKSIFASTSILVQRLVNLYLVPKSEKDINLLLPPKIKKPTLPPVSKLIKSEFETKEMFNKKVKQAMLEREKKIKRLQLNFRKQVEARNQKIKELQRLHKEDLKRIEEEYKAKKEKVKQYMPYFTSLTMKYLVGNLALKNLRYDAEHQLMYADLYGSNKNYQKKIYLKVPLDEAKEFKLRKNYTPIVTYSYSKNRLTLNQIKVDDYYAKLTQKDYQPKEVEVKLKDKKINTNYAQNDLSLQNPNLKDKYTVEGISYRENVVKTIANFQDDLPNLLSNATIATKDAKKWLFVIGVEKYDNTDDVTYSKRSAETFVKVAQKILGVTNRNSYALIGNQATSGAIEDRLNRMLENVKRGDSIYFFYSGHGIPLLPNRIPYLLPKDKIPDYIGRSPFFKLTNIYNLLSNSKASKVIAVMDSCFSGSTDGYSVFKGVAGSVLAPKKVTFNHEKMVVLTAGREKQFSNMYPQKGHRLFSYFVMKSLLEGKRAVSDVYNDVFPKVKSVSNGFGDLKRQEPTLDGNKNLRF